MKTVTTTEFVFDREGKIIKQIVTYEEFPDAGSWTGSVNKSEA